MTFELWFAFTIAAGALIAIPGPTNLMVMAYGIRYGTKLALGTVFGVVPGVMVAMTLSFKYDVCPSVGKDERNDTKSKRSTDNESNRGGPC
jgi:hypothetical protein